MYFFHDEDRFSLSQQFVTPALFVSKVGTRSRYSTRIFLKDRFICLLVADCGILR